MRKMMATFRSVAAIGVAVTLVTSGQVRADYAWHKVERPHAIGGGMLAVHDGTLYAIGGSVWVGPTNYDDIYTDVIHSYNPDTNAWSDSAVGHLPYAAAEGKSPLIQGDRILISPCIGPTQNNGWGTHHSLIEWPLAGDAYETAAYPDDHGYQHIWHAVLASAEDGTVYSLGGWDGNTVNNIYRYSDSPPALSLLPETLQGGGEVLSGCRTVTGDIALFGRHPSYGDAGLVEVFDPDTETVIFRDHILPPDLTWAGSAWTDLQGTTYAAATDTGAVYEFDPATYGFTQADFTLPEPTPGFQLHTRVAYDEQRDWLYVLEDKWSDSTETWESSLWIGTPEPGTLGFLVLGGVAVILRQRCRFG